jgi:hypothetical protein
MKSKLSIEEIKITKEQLTDLESELKRSSITSNGKKDIVKKYAGGVCIICGSVPSKMISLDADGATVIERYCEECFKKWE